MFLRCDVFNTDIAVARYAKYWVKRVALFGPEDAFQPLVLGSALANDRFALELGFVQLVRGVSDPKGRAILYVDPSVQDSTKYSRISMCRALWYTIFAALESENAQKHGIVVLSNPSQAKFSQTDHKLIKTVLPVMQGAIPMRLTAWHICHPSPFSSVVLTFARLFMSERIKKRFMLHRGSTCEVLHQLKEYGIDRNAVPAPLGGDVQMDHLIWVNERRSRGL